MFIRSDIPKAKASDGFLYEALLKLLAPANQSFTIIYSLLAFGLLFIQAISFNRLINEQRLLPKPNYLTGMSYLLITSLFTEWYTLSAPLIVNTFIIWILPRLCNLYNDLNAKTTLFNMGLITGIATFFYFPSVGFFILVMAGIGISRSFKLQEWIIALIGIITPYYFLGAWLFLNDRLTHYRFPAISMTFSKFHEPAWTYIGVIFIMALIVIGSVFIRNDMERLLVQSRKNWALIYLYLLVTFLLPFLNPGDDFSSWILAAVPVAALSAAAFLYPERKWFTIFMHWSLVILSVVMGYFLKL